MITFLTFTFTPLFTEKLQDYKFGKGVFISWKRLQPSRWLSSWLGSIASGKDQRQAFERRRNRGRSFMLNKLAKYTYSPGYRRSYEYLWRQSWLMRIEHTCMLHMTHVNPGVETSHLNGLQLGPVHQKVSSGHKALKFMVSVNWPEPVCGRQSLVFLPGESYGNQPLV